MRFGPTHSFLVRGVGSIFSGPQVHTVAIARLASYTWLSGIATSIIIAFMLM